MESKFVLNASKSSAKARSINPLRALFVEERTNPQEVELLIWDVMGEHNPADAYCVGGFFPVHAANR